MDVIAVVNIFNMNLVIWCVYGVSFFKLCIKFNICDIILNNLFGYLSNGKLVYSVIDWCIYIIIVFKLIIFTFHLISNYHSYYIICVLCSIIT